jgi:phage terminase large subunit-like protein
MANVRNYLDIATQYAKRAVADKKGRTHGKWERLACARFLADLKAARSGKAQFTFDERYANEACGFLELLPHVEGRWDTPTLVLHESHVFFVVNLFGFRKPDGTRRYTDALLAVARKNAKSTLAAGICLFVQMCESEVGPQVISAATTGSQARIVFNVAKRQVESTPDLREAFDVEALANSILSNHNGGSFRPINAKASTQDGLNPSCVVLDEVHAHKEHDLLNVLRSAAGARRSPLFLFTTTEGYATPGPWPELRHFAHQVLSGVVEAEHFLVLIYAIDDEDTDFDPRIWRKANPLIDVNPILRTEIEKQAIEAKAMPSRRGEFRIKRLNRPATAANAAIDLTRWDKCGGEVDLKALEKVPCWGGLDLASTADMTTFWLTWRLEGRWLAWGRYWVPEDAVRGRTERGMSFYAGWREQGFIEVTEGDVTDYSVIENAVADACNRFDVRSIGFDPWNASDLVNRLTERRLPMTKFIQGARSYHPPMQELERAYTSGQFAHGGHPVLRWNAANLVARRDANNNQAPDKKRSPDKIDGIAALLMAMGVSLSQQDERKEIKQGFVVINR